MGIEFVCGILAPHVIGLSVGLFCLIALIRQYVSLMLYHIFELLMNMFTLLKHVYEMRKTSAKLQFESLKMHLPDTFMGVYTYTVPKLVSVHNTLFYQYCAIMAILSLFAAAQLPCIYSPDRLTQFGGLISLHRYEYYVIVSFAAILFYLIFNTATSSVDILLDEKFSKPDIAFKMGCILVYFVDIEIFLYIFISSLTGIDGLPSSNDVRVLASYNCLSMSKQEYYKALHREPSVYCEIKATQGNESFAPYHFDMLFTQGAIDVLANYSLLRTSSGIANFVGDGNAAPDVSNSEASKAMINTATPLPSELPH